MSFFFEILPFLPLFICAYFASFWREMMDECMRNRWKEPFLGHSVEWLNSATSWENKNRSPRWLNQTILVWLWDGEHRFQFYSILSSSLAAGFALWVATANTWELPFQVLAAFLIYLVGDGSFGFTKETILKKIPGLNHVQ